VQVPQALQEPPQPEARRVLSLQRARPASQPEARPALPQQREPPALPQAQDSERGPE